MTTNRIARPLALLACTFQLAACATPTAMPTPTTPSESASAAPASVEPSAPARIEPGTTPSASPTTAPSASTGASAVPSAAPTGPVASAPAPDPLRRVILSGRVYDLQGATVSGALITVRSLDASVPYTATATTVGGSWVVNSVPEGANVEVIASRDGWTSRRRVGSFQASTQTRNEMDFGGLSGVASGGAPYFISKYPEITRTEPVDEAVGIEPTLSAYKLYLSESLDDTNRRRFENALRVLPANDAANGDSAGTTVDLDTLEDRSYPLLRQIDGNTAISPYSIKTGTVFLGESSTRVRVSWDATGTVATLSFPAPLVANDSDEAAYQVVLVSGGNEERIRDGDGNQLGTDQDGRLSRYPALGDLVLAPFQERDLRLSTITGLTDNSVEARWAATHDNLAGFEVKRDNLRPVLTSVDAAVVGNDTRIELTFSEPMAAYNGTSTGLRHPGLGDDANDLLNYVFMLGERVGDLDDQNLDEDDAVTINPLVTTSYGAVDNEREKEFRLDGAAFVSSRTGAADGSVFVDVDSKNPSIVRLHVIGRPNFLARQARFLKARVEGVGDPAGNSIQDKDADKNQPIGAI